MSVGWSNKKSYPNLGQNHICTVYSVYTVCLGQTVYTYSIYTVYTVCTYMWPTTALYKLTDEAWSHFEVMAPFDLISLLNLCLQKSNISVKMDLYQFTITTCQRVMRTSDRSRTHLNPSSTLSSWPLGQQTALSKQSNRFQWEVSWERSWRVCSPQSAVADRKIHSLHCTFISPLYVHRVV